MVGNSEFQQPGDKGARDSGDQSAGQLQKETQTRDLATTSYDSAKTNVVALNGEHSSWMSMTADPKGFEAKTEALKQQSPEAIKATIAQNSAAADSVRTYMASIETKINNVLKAQKAQEELEKANRSA